jgi:ankyrin repeat protein
MPFFLAFAALLVWLMPLHAAERPDNRVVIPASLNVDPDITDVPAEADQRRELVAAPPQPEPDSQPPLLLHDAAINNIPKWATHLLDRGTDIDERDAQGHTALMVAAAFNSFDVAKVLLARGADPLAVDRVRGDTALHYAARAGWPKLVDLLLAHGMDVNRQSLKSGDTVLHFAASIGSGSVIELLVKRGAGVDLPNHLGVRPMQYALRQGHHKAAQLLIKLGARPDDLQDAVNAGDIARIQYFLARRTDVNASDLFGTPLHRAAATGQTYIANMLIDAGADLEAIGEPAGNRPLHMAALNNQPKVAALLIKRGAMVDAPNQEGRTPLMIAAQFGNLEAARTLVALGADPNKEDSIYRDSSIHVAVLGGSKEMVELLLAHGANVNHKSNHSGESPLVYAAITGDAAMVALLVARGGDITQQDDLGRTVSSILNHRHKGVALRINKLPPP